MKLAFTAAARRDLYEVGDYIARDSRRQALRFIAALEGFCATLLAQPERYPLLTHRADREIRRAPYADYLIFYRVRNGLVEILRVVHAARDVDRIVDGL